jgi:hypothetical protein
MEVDAITAPQIVEAKAEEDSQKGEKATYKSFKYVLTFTRVLNVANVFSIHTFSF